jgi:cobalt-zinc-cadmium efflux system outer membrane protein
MRISPGRAAAAALLLAAAGSGCASTSPEGSQRDVVAMVERRIGQKVRFRRGGEEDAEVDRSIRSLLARELTVDGAVQVALLNNRMLHAEYEDLSVAQADLVQAGLLKNPSIDAGLLFHIGHGGAPNLHFGVEQDFLSLLFIPARRALAEAELERAKLRVGAAVMDVAADVRVAYFTLQGAQQVTAMRRTIAEATAAGAEIARQQNEAGTLSDLDTAVEQGLNEQVKLDLARSEAEIAEARERLNRLMGLWGVSTTWSIAEKLPEMPASDPPLDRVESLAVERRLELSAARQEVQAAAHALSIAKSGRFLGGAEVGGEAEREEGDWQAGPSVRLEIPIFDQGQAAIAGREAELRRSEHRLSALAVDIRSEAREARVRVVLARAVAEHYRKVLVPLRERIVALTQEQYDAMLLGVYQLLEAKRTEVDTYREYIEAVRDYWIAWVNLERVSGGKLTGAPSRARATAAPASKAPSPVSPATSTPHEHHHP